MVFKFVQSIVLNVSQALSSISKGDVSPLPVVLVLGDFRIHVCTLYGGNIASNIEAAVDEGLSRHTTLGILYIKSYNCHIRFQRDFDNM